MKALRLKSGQLDLGPDHDDWFAGAPFDDIFAGLGGFDWLFGTALDDELSGGNGKDVVFGCDGDDLLSGGNGKDLLFGGAGNDLLIGGNGKDMLFGGIGHDVLRGGAGNDLLDGGILADSQSDAGFRDTDYADYSTASSGVEVNLATGIALDGEGGVDTLRGIEGVIGSAYADVLTGSSAFAEYFRGGAGNDLIDGGLGFDTAEYADATGPISVDLAAGWVTGDESVGTDTLIGVELIEGTEHADSYFAVGFSSPSLPGGIVSGFNAFEGRGGDDVITGNGGTRVEYSSATAGVEVNLVTGVGKSLVADEASVGTDTFTGVNAVRGSSYADQLLGGNAFPEFYDGRGGNDFISGGAGYDRADYAFNGPVGVGIDVELGAGTVIGDPTYTGTDTLRGVEAIRGSHLDDLYDASTFSPFSTNAGSLGFFNEFEGMAGDDTIIGNGSTRISYSLAREGVTVDLENGTASGGASVGSDTIVGGVNNVRGSNFDDVLLGSTGFDNLAGGFGNDLLRGGPGGDAIDGGPGSDRIDFDALIDGNDNIFNFETGPGGDVLDLVGLLADWTTYDNGAGGPLGDYVHVDTGGNFAFVSIDADGAGPGGLLPLAIIHNGAGITLDSLVADGNLDYLM